MSETPDTNAEIWKSDETARMWAQGAAERESLRIEHWRMLAKFLPFATDEAFTFCDLGAGSGAASREILERHQSATAILTDFSPQMIAEGERCLAAFAGRFSYVEFDMSAPPWPDAIGENLDAIVTSLCVHHLPDARKQTLFREIYERLRPGGAYLNYDPVTSPDPLASTAFQRVGDIDDPSASQRRANLSAYDKARHENHVRYMIPLDQQLGYLRAAGFAGVDVYWKYLENVIYGGVRAR